MHRRGHSITVAGNMASGGCLDLDLDLDVDLDLDLDLDLGLSRISARRQASHRCHRRRMLEPMLEGPSLLTAAASPAAGP